MQPGEELVAAGPLVPPLAVPVVLLAGLDLAQVEHTRIAQLFRQGLGSRISPARLDDGPYFEDTGNRIIFYLTSKYLP